MLAASRPRPALRAGDGSLALAVSRQLRRASCSMALNVAEGMYSRGQNRQVRYHSALGSARETLACLELAQRCCTVAPPVPLSAQLNRIIGTLVKLTGA